MFSGVVVVAMARRSPCARASRNSRSTPGRSGTSPLARHLTYMRVLLAMQSGDKFIGSPSGVERRRMAVEKKANAFPPAGDLQQL